MTYSKRSLVIKTSTKNKKIDYIQLLDINKIISKRNKNSKFRIFVAYYLRSTRIIDNI